MEAVNLYFVLGGDLIYIYLANLVYFFALLRCLIDWQLTSALHFSQITSSTVRQMYIYCTRLTEPGVILVCFIFLVLLWVYAHILPP